ncbi:ankyrin repeat domain-containing protein [Aliivibrio salmonicida]|uniref:ankyrin repeat domain-containing protein n=1 Tax=Aliivibrio salmonicida TaxID=40269 RepID=UPI00406CEB51
MKKSIAYFYLLFLLLPLSSFATEKEQTTNEDYQELITLYFAAARTGNDDVLSTFLNAGFPVNQINSKSYTALMTAAYYGNQSSIEVLLEKGANACLQDKRGNTAIMGAVIKGEFSIAKRLYKINCSESIKNNAGLTLQEFTHLYGQSDLFNN